MDSIENLELIKQYDKLDTEELIEKFIEFRNRWLKSENLIEMGMENLKLSFPLSIIDVERNFEICLYEIIEIHMLFCKEELIDEIFEETNMNYKFEFNKIFEIMYYVHNCILCLCKANNVIQPNYNPQLNTEIGVARFTPVDYSTNTPYQNLLLYLLKTMYDKGYKRYKEFCYKKVFNEQGKFTYSWEQVMDIKSFVFQQTQKENQFEQWKNLTKDKGNLNAACYFLETCKDPQFRDLIKNRMIFSFRNGVYICKRTGTYDDYFYRYGDKPELGPNVVSCKYFDQDFNNYDDIKEWYNIPTPSMQSILNYQFDTSDEYLQISKWVYILIGRLLYNAGELDDWQIMPFIKGIAGSGKSSILTNIVQRFYDINDIGVLSNDMEKTFGLSGIADKYLFIAPEIKKSFALSQALLQSMISAEDISVPIKHKTAEGIKWNIPGIMAGNELPSYQDSSGSISRRFVVINFKKKVKEKDSDPLLRDKLLNEIPAIIKKCNLAYLEAVKMYGKKNIWPFLPKFFHETRDELKEQTNYMQHFLTSGKLQFGEEFFCSEKDFKTAFNDHCKENNFPRLKFNSELYALPFIDLSEKYDTEFKIEKKKKRYKGLLKHVNFVVGIGIIEDDEDEIE